jgi:hypothetical protein
MISIPTILPSYFALPFCPGIAMSSGDVEAPSRTSPRLVGFRIGFLVGSFRAANLLRIGLLYREDRTITIILNVAHCSTNSTALLEPCLTLNLLTTTIVALPSNASKWQMGFNSAFKGLNYRLSKYSIYLNTNLLLLPVSLPERRCSCYQHKHSRRLLCRVLTNLKK